MAAESAPPEIVLVGRRPDRDILDESFDRAAAGSAQTVLVLGRAGVGKTALVQDVCHRRAGMRILSGACLPLLSVAAPFLALRDVLRGVDPITRPPRIPEGASGSRVMSDVDDWVSQLSLDSPVALVIDDLQWADRGTLDVLSYLVAGPATRRVAIVATIREEHAATPSSLSRWLADVRRMPGLTQLTLAPLDRSATEEQMSQILGGAPHQSLVDDVHARGGGNPLWTKLMVTGLPVGARRLPDRAGADLSSVVAGAWGGVEAASRDAATALAVAGVPMSAGELARVLREREADVERRWDIAANAGLIERRADGSVWFRHPLHAEVLEVGLHDGVRRTLHAAFAEQLERSPAPDDVQWVVRIADHRFAANDPLRAYRWAVRAATVAENGGSPRDAMRLLRRAAALAETVAAEESVTELLQRYRAAAATAGDHYEELDATEMLLARIDESENRELVAQLLVRRLQLHFHTGRAFFEMAEASRMRDAAAGLEGTGTHALVLAEFAHSSMWHDLPGAADLAERAVVEARSANDDRALSFALTAVAMAEVCYGDPARALECAIGAVEAGLRAGDWWAFCHATLWEGNALEAWQTRRFAETLRRRRVQLAAAGAPRTSVAFIAADESSSWLACGEWAMAAECLREVFASDPGPVADVSARLCAARLAVLQGRQREAEQHIARAEELFATTSGFLAFAFDAVRAEVFLGAGDAADAYRAAMTGVTIDGVSPTMCEWLLPLAARALADLIWAARNDAGQSAELRESLAELVRAHPEALRDFGVESPLLSHRHARAMDELYAAEAARGLDQPDASERWLAAAAALEEAMLPWEEAYALGRAAEALLSRDRDRVRGAKALRAAVDRARVLGAKPIDDDMRSLARRARITLREPRVLSGGAGFTAREREILSLVVAGRTYGEIARELVISEKTVSTHISHLLAKTGTSSRVELAGVAERAGMPTEDTPASTRRGDR